MAFGVSQEGPGFRDILFGVQDSSFGVWHFRCRDCSERQGCCINGLGLGLGIETSVFRDWCFGSGVEGLYPKPYVLNRKPLNLNPEPL